MLTVEFVEGAISAQSVDVVEQSIHAEATNGAVLRFSGVVRSDQHGNIAVKSIRYSCYDAMLNTVSQRIMQELATEYELAHLRVWHSLGEVLCSESSLVILCSAKHRKNALAALSLLIDRIKSEWPIWGEEIMSDGSIRTKQCQVAKARE